MDGCDIIMAPSINAYMKRNDLIVILDRPSTCESSLKSRVEVKNLLLPKSAEGK